MRDGGWERGARNGKHDGKHERWRQEWREAATTRAWRASFLPRPLDVCCGIFCLLFHSAAVDTKDEGAVCAQGRGARRTGEAGVHGGHRQRADGWRKGHFAGHLNSKPPKNMYWIYGVRRRSAIQLVLFCLPRFRSFVFCAHMHLCALSEQRMGRGPRHIQETPINCETIPEAFGLHRPT